MFQVNFVVPVLLFGSEDWLLTDSHLDCMEVFQGEIGRILKFSPKPPELLYSATASSLIQKLCLLYKVSYRGESVSCCVYPSLATANSQFLRPLKNACGSCIHSAVGVTMVVFSTSLIRFMKTHNHF